jgi:hypothetical protein
LTLLQSDTNNDGTIDWSLLPLIPWQPDQDLVLVAWSTCCGTIAWVMAIANKTERMINFIFMYIYLRQMFIIDYESPLLYLIKSLMTACFAVKFYFPDRFIREMQKLANQNDFPLLIQHPYSENIIKTGINEGILDLINFI